MEPPAYTAKIARKPKASWKIECVRPFIKYHCEGGTVKKGDVVKVCFRCKGKGCCICKGTGKIIVHEGEDV